MHRSLTVICSSAVFAAACATSISPPLAPGEPLAAPVEASPLPAMAHEATSPVEAIDWGAQFASIDEAVGEAITLGQIPGCVVAIGRHDGILFERAYGSRALYPDRELMTNDTVFDLASLTKPIATATSIMLLVERGLVMLDAPVATYIPDFARSGKGAVTLRHLLTHTAGLPAETPLSSFDHGRAEAMRYVYDLTPRAAPGAKFQYSDVGFLVLEEVVRRVSGMELDAFARANIFEPLRMNETRFKPEADVRERVAPTSFRDGAWIRGDVHDPRAWRLGGVAGNAGLFSTADDLSRFARALLNGGELDGTRVLAAKTVQQMLAPHDVPGGVRALGWDVRSAYSKNRGDSLSARAVGHGGYTGTSLWIDRAKDLFVVVLSNRVHPDDHGQVNALAGHIASVAGDIVAPEMTTRAPCAEPGQVVEAGVDVLRDEKLAPLRGAHVGLITNVTGKARDGTTTIDVLLHAPDVTLVALFAPEHGLGAAREGLIGDDHDEASGLPVYSLYGGGFRPTAESLEGVDTLVFDVQDVGTRFYTYASTMHRAMQTAAEAGLRFVVLDRPNPIDGVRVEGPVLASSKGFVNHFPLPVRHGMTLGELALLIDAEEHLGLQLDVVSMRGWRREMAYDETGLPWVSPSPNLRSTDEELLYPGIGLLEGTNLSVGRGTASPFEVIGAPWINAIALVAAVTHEAVPGVSFEATTFTPDASTFRGVECHGVKISIQDRKTFAPVRTGLAIARSLAALHTEWHVADLGKLAQDARVVEAVRTHATLDDIVAIAAEEVPTWRAKRDKYLLYPAAAACSPKDGTERASVAAVKPKEER